MTNKVAWTTEKEIAFLDTIGDRRDESGLRMKVRYGREELLRGYLEGAKLRKDWGSLFQSKVTEHAEMLLNEEERK